LNLVYESNEINNDGATNAATTVTPGSSPKLVVSNITAPNTGIAGRSLAVTWNVTNNGADTGNVPIKDSVYLSYGATFDPATSFYVGTVPHTGGLATGASYSQNPTLQLPAGLAGTFYLFVDTDSDGSIFQNDPSGSAAHVSHTVQITLAPPADLVAGTIT